MAVKLTEKLDVPGRYPPFEQCGVFKTANDAWAAVIASCMRSGPPPAEKCTITFEISFAPDDMVGTHIANQDTCLKEEVKAPTLGERVRSWFKKG